MFQHMNMAPDQKFCGICGQPLLGDPDDQPFAPLGPMDGECYRSQQMDDEIDAANTLGDEDEFGF